MILSYARCSTEEQASEGTTTLAEQQRKNRALAMMRGVDGFDIVDYVDAGVSGSIPLCERPEGKRMLKEMKAGDVICAAKLDRIFRSALDALQTVELLKTKQIDLVLLDIGTDPVNGNGISRLFFTMISAFAEFERTRIAERMHDGREAKRRNGGCIGQVPYGYRKVGSGKTSVLEEDPNEQAVIAKAKALSKDHGLYTIAKKITKAGHLSRAGRPFREMQIQRMLSNG
jgi:putative DNA-invertase from lambdoid prophage Rac